MAVTSDSQKKQSDLAKQEEQALRDKEALDRAAYDATLPNRGIPKWRAVSGTDPYTQHELAEQQRANKEGTNILKVAPGAVIEKLPSGVYWEDKGNPNDKKKHHVYWNAEKGEAYPVPRINAKTHPKQFGDAMEQTIKLLLSQGVDPIHISCDGNPDMQGPYAIKIIIDRMDKLGAHYTYDQNVREMLHQNTSPGGFKPQGADTQFLQREAASAINSQRNKPFHDIAQDRVLEELSKRVEKDETDAEKNARRDELKTIFTKSAEDLHNKNKNTYPNQKEALLEILKTKLTNLKNTHPDKLKDYGLENIDTEQLDGDQLLNKMLDSHSYVRDALMEEKVKQAEKGESIEVAEATSCLNEEYTFLEAKVKTLEMGNAQLESHLSGSEKLLKDQPDQAEKIEKIRDTSKNNREKLMQTSEQEVEKLIERQKNLSELAKKLQTNSRGLALDDPNRTEAQALAKKIAALELRIKKAELKTSELKTRDKNLTANLAAPTPSPRPGATS